MIPSLTALTIQEDDHITTMKIPIGVHPITQRTASVTKRTTDQLKQNRHRVRIGNDTFDWRKQTLVNQTNRVKALKRVSKDWKHVFQDSVRDYLRNSLEHVAESYREHLDSMCILEINALSTVKNTLWYFSYLLDCVTSDPKLVNSISTLKGINQNGVNISNLYTSAMNSMEGYLKNVCKSDNTKEAYKYLEVIFDYHLSSCFAMKVDNEPDEVRLDPVAPDRMYDLLSKSINALKMEKRMYLTKEQQYIFKSLNESDKMQLVTWCGHLFPLFEVHPFYGNHVSTSLRWMYLTREVDETIGVTPYEQLLFASGATSVKQAVVALNYIHAILARDPGRTERLKAWLRSEGEITLNKWLPKLLKEPMDKIIQPALEFKTEVVSTSHEFDTLVKLYELLYPDSNEVLKYACSINAILYAPGTCKYKDAMESCAEHSSY